MTLERVNLDTCQDRLQVVLHQNRYDFVLARLTGNETVLEIGTGPGVFSRQLLNHCRSYVGVEYDAATCLEARRNIHGQAQIVEADARSLPFGEECFSFIICLEVLEHLGDYKAGVENIHRCLRPHGKAIVSVPYRRVGGPSPHNEHHLYEPGKEELISLFSQLFEHVEVYYQYFEEDWWWTLARRLHLRRLVGISQIYADLSAGAPHATARLKVDKRAAGLIEGLILVVSGKKTPVKDG